jgi:general secretion pathway protein H
MFILPTKPRRQQSGFTLIEVMVVLVIIGIVVSSVVLSIRTDDIEEHMEIEMRRVQALLNLARDEAVLQGQEIALAVEGNSYVFETFGEEGWKPIADDRVFRAREVVAGTELSLLIDDFEINLAQQKEESEDDTDNEKRSRIFILSSGEIMPFELILRKKDQTLEYRIKVEGDGEIKLVLPEDLG